MLFHPSTVVLILDSGGTAYQHDGAANFRLPVEGRDISHSIEPHQSKLEHIKLLRFQISIRHGTDIELERKNDDADA